MQGISLLFSSMFCKERKIVHVGAEKKSSLYNHNKFILNLEIKTLLLMMHKIRQSVKFGEKIWYEIIIWHQFSICMIVRRIVIAKCICRMGKKVLVSLWTVYCLAFVFHVLWRIEWRNNGKMPMLRVVKNGEGNLKFKTMVHRIVV